MKKPVSSRVYGFFLLLFSKDKWLQRDVVLFSPASGHIVPPVPETTALRESQSRFHGLCRSDFRAVVQMCVDIRRGDKIVVPKPFLNVL